jgi:CheY-like chemotaxis protein
LALIDSDMPDVFGFDIAAAIRGNARELPILILSSDDHALQTGRHREASACNFLVKPVSRIDLFRALQTALMKEAKGEPVELKKQPNLRVLVAEDSPDNRFLVKVYLEKDGYDLTFADNGQQAVELFESNEFDLVLMDIQMPIMDGLTATAAMRTQERRSRRRSVPILALTANAMADDIAASREAGCDAHLSKPISKRNLITAIEEHLAKARNSLLLAS